MGSWHVYRLQSGYLIIYTWMHDEYDDFFLTFEVYIIHIFRMDKEMPIEINN